MSFKLVHTYNDCFELSYGGLPLYRYVYVPQTAPVEAPRPYFHPLYTLAGDVVTGFRPQDHRWHHGLSMTSAHLSGQNFWGGRTYVRDEGYVMLPNIGSQQHRSWLDKYADERRAYLKELVAWVTEAGDEWIEEERRIEVVDVDADAGWWALDIGLRLTNVSGEALEFGSPTTAGRPNAGYGGLFWRGARDLTGGTILTADGAATSTNDDAVMGHSAAWLAFVGGHDGVDRESTLLFIDHPDNPRFPTKWYARTVSIPTASFALSFDETYTLQAGDELSLNYRIVIANGAWSRAQIAAFVGTDG